jgi:glycosyltransferase involved in cell wall biosynthesis
MENLNFNGNPLITVLMPVYNGAPYLKETIESILNQTYSCFEFLIINDCSTDHSLDIIRSFNDTRIVVHNNEKNIGQTKSLNVGLTLARGEYIAINDADDLSLPQRLAKELEYMQKNPQCAVVGTNALIMNQQGKVTRKFCKLRGEKEILITILHGTPVIHGSVLMRKKVILEQGGYDESIRISQDFALWSALLRKGIRLDNIADFTVVIRYFSDSISFRENDTQTMDAARTFKENIKALTGLEVTLDQARDQHFFFAYPQRLSWDEFSSARDFFIKQYSILQERGECSLEFLKRNLQSRLREFTQS